MIGTHMMTERRRRDEVVVRLERPSRTVVALTSMQIANFAGNALELQGHDGRRILALSTTALAAFDADQCATSMTAQHSFRFILRLSSVPAVRFAAHWQGFILCRVCRIPIPPREKVTTD